MKIRKPRDIVEYTDWLFIAFVTSAVAAVVLLLLLGVGSLFALAFGWIE